MLALERRNVILEKLNAEKRVLVSELSVLFEVSEETVRRDLEKLAEEGLVTKTYGGALLNEEQSFADMPFVIRKKQNVGEKQAIAKLICGMVSDGERVMCDSSSTAVFVAKQLKSKDNLTIITNSVEILVELSDVSGWHVISTGGVVKEGTLSLTGSRVEKAFASYNADIAVISCKGIDIAGGVTDSNEGNAGIKQSILASAKRRVLAIDHTKFDRAALIKICAIGGFTHIVTDKKPSDDWITLFDTQNIACIYPNNAV